jgi:hypothetical protein
LLKRNLSGEILSIKFITRTFTFMAFLGAVALAAAAQQFPSPKAGGLTAQAPQSSSSAHSTSQDATPADQQPTAKPSPTVPADKDDKSKDKSKDKDKPQDANGQNKSGTSNDRLFFALPNFLTVQNSGHIPPLTPKQKFAVVARGAFDKVQIPWFALLSSISQAEDSEPGFGQGWEGYGKRFGSAAADGTIENFMVGAVLPSMLHQDPRFFQESEGSFSHRTGYAVSRIFVTRTDSGKAQFNYSEIVGSALSAAISTNTYHPTSKLFRTPTGVRYIPSDRTLPNTLSVWATQVGYDTITICVKEFWPDIQRKMKHKNKVDAH